MSIASKPINEAQMYISPQQAAGLAGVALRTIRVWIERAYNPLPSARIGRRRLIKKDLLEKWIDEQIPPPQYDKDELKSIIDRVMSQAKKKK